MVRPAWSGLFEPAPPRWGLRGDPLLWQELARELEALPWPETEARFLEAFARVFERLVGYPLAHPDPVQIERYDRGGMSGGYVSPAFWRETALPLLQDRWARASGP